MSLRHALLGLLADEPASGYALTRKFEASLNRYAWSARHSQIYPELARLADEGLIEVAEEGARGRRTYAITDAGHAELRSWLVDQPAHTPVRNVLVLKMFLLSTLTPADAKAFLTRLAATAERELAALRAQVAELDSAESAQGFGRFAAEYGLREYELMRDWAAWAMDRIEQAEVG